LYPSAQAIRERRDDWLAYLQRLFGMQRETALASFPLDIVLSTRLVTRQPGAPSCLADPSSSFPCSYVADYLIHAKVVAGCGFRQGGFSVAAGLGQMYEKLLASGTVDDRMALMLFFIVEKLRGEVQIPTIKQQVLGCKLAQLLKAAQPRMGLVHQCRLMPCRSLCCRLG
jgi:hypothetical protein